MKYLTEFAARSILSKYGLALPRAHLMQTGDEAAAFIKEIGFPIVLKLMSPDILHKSDAGCVKIVRGSGALKSAFSELLANARKYKADAKIEGILLEEYISGTELIIGAKRDAQFGPVILFGLGGIFVEAMHDVSIRLVPIQRKDAGEMIREIKGHRMLMGYRGKNPANIKAIEDALLALSKMIAEHPEIQEMDINPLFASEKGVVVGDARIAL